MMSRFPSISFRPWIVALKPAARLFLGMLGWPGPPDERRPRRFTVIPGSPLSLSAVNLRPKAPPIPWEARFSSWFAIWGLARKSSSMAFVSMRWITPEASSSDGMEPPASRVIGPEDRHHLIEGLVHRPRIALEEVLPGRDPREPLGGVLRDPDLDGVGPPAEGGPQVERIPRIARHHERHHLFPGSHPRIERHLVLDRLSELRKCDGEEVLPRRRIELFRHDLTVKRGRGASASPRPLEDRSGARSISASGLREGALRRVLPEPASHVPEELRSEDDAVVIEGVVLLRHLEELVLHDEGLHLPVIDEGVEDVRVGEGGGGEVGRGGGGGVPPPGGGGPGQWGGAVPGGGGAGNGAPGGEGGTPHRL